MFCQDEPRNEQARCVICHRQRRVLSKANRHKTGVLKMGYKYRQEARFYAASCFRPELTGYIILLLLLAVGD